MGLIECEICKSGRFSAQAQSTCSLCDA
jgi:hypothetical protein